MYQITLINTTEGNARIIIIFFLFHCCIRVCATQLTQNCDDYVIYFRNRQLMTSDETSISS